MHPPATWFFADVDHIRSIDTSGIISTVAGNGTGNLFGDGGLALNAGLNFPTDVLPDAQGNLYVADEGDNVIRRIDRATGIITTVAGNGTAGYIHQFESPQPGDGGSATQTGLYYPQSLALDSLNYLYIGSYDQGIRRVSLDTGIIETYLSGEVQRNHQLRY